LPGSGMLIYHVDEGVMGLDYDNDGLNNFYDNQLQNDWDRKFIRLVEADGLVNFGGSYYKGYGQAEDMFRDDRNTAFTPNTNPPAIDNSGNNTHIYITDIGRVIDTIGEKPVYLDSLMRFDLETDRLAEGFPKRAGYPLYGFSPLVDDIDKDGNDEIIVVADTLLSVITTAGESFLLEYTGCEECPIYEDVAIATVNPGQPHPLALYAILPGTITTGPVTGDFNMADSNKYVAVGYQSGGNGWVHLYRLRDNDLDGLADNTVMGTVVPFTMSGLPIALSFGDILWALDSEGNVVRVDSLSFSTVKRYYNVPEEMFHGVCRLGDALIVMAGDSSETGDTKLYYIDTDTISFSLDGYYNYGPVLVDVNIDGIQEVVAFSPDGDGIIVSVDLTLAVPPFPLPVFNVLAQKTTGYHMTTNPVAGDIDSDGYPDIIIGGTNRIYAFNQELTLKTDFPLEVNDREMFLDDDVIWAPVIGDIEKGGSLEIVFPTNIGNLYSFGAELSYGFPLSAGEIEAGSPVVFSDTTGGKLGYLGADGWFYAWDVDADTVTDYWPMAGHDPSGSFAFDSEKLMPVGEYADPFPEEKFYNYPNPVVDGYTTIRYFLGDAASDVTLTIYDLSGEEIARYDGPTRENVDNEFVWSCGDVTPGVYRCVIDVDFGYRQETSFTDIAIIR